MEVADKQTHKNRHTRRLTIRVAYSVQRASPYRFLDIGYRMVCIT